MHNKEFSKKTKASLKRLYLAVFDAISEIPFSCATQIVSYRCSAEKCFCNVNHRNISTSKL